MRLVIPKRVFEDARGEIIDVLVKETLEYVTIATFKKGATRGNHFHKATVQYNYILEGQVKLLTQVPGEKVVSTVLSVGELAVTEEMERHSITGLTEAKVMVFTRGIRGGEDYEKDTYRLDNPLKET